MDASKEEFLREFGDDYGYPNGPKSIDEIRATEFKRLHGNVYLDHAGATLYSELQLEAIFKDLNSNVYGNPHSQSDTSSATNDIVREARQQVLDYCKASPKEYSCIFTSGATAALKLVGECFPWSSQSCFSYTTENHNSVLGIREYALDQGAAAFAIDIEEHVNHGGSNGNLPSMRILHHEVQRRKNKARSTVEESKGGAYHLFAFPSECNFSGLRFNLDLVKTIKEYPEKIMESSSFCKSGQWMVLIDAAKGCATEPPDISLYPADFVVISFYKLFGYPTGLGALIARNDAAKILKKTYFSGGTVAASIADIDFVKRRKSVEELFEDGTISYLSLASIQHGFNILNSLTISAISRHTTSLASYVRKKLLALKHENGAKVCTLYGISKALCHGLGPTVSFNLKRLDGTWYGYREVEKLASLSGIQLRTGCFCNPGACAKYLGLSHLELLSNIEAGHVCWDDNDIINGKPTGAVRVSFGYMSTFEDAKKLIDFVTSSFVTISHGTGNGYQIKQGPDSRLKAASFSLKSVTIYPIKSCGGFSVESWPLSSSGLRHDREWVLTSLSGEILTQKKVPEMCFISTSIDLKKGILFVESPRCQVILSINFMSNSFSSGREEITLHGQRYEVEAYGKEINVWFSNAIGRQCTLLRCFSSNHNFCMKKCKSTDMCRRVKSMLNFSNEAQFLLISEESVSDLNSRLKSKEVQNAAQGTGINAMRFRPNLVISGGEPYTEDGWRNLRIGNIYFTSLGGCNRCQMINVVNEAGQVRKSNEPLATLASYRRDKGKILFGILLKYDKSIGGQDGDDNDDDDDELWLQTGQDVHPNIV